MKVTNEPVPKLRAALEENDYGLVMLPSVLRELKGLSFSKTAKTARYAKNALKALNLGMIKSISSGISGNIDADIEMVEYASKHRNSMVATLDGALLSEMEKKRVPYLTLRNDAPFKREFRGATYLTTKKPRV
jgi:rRNA-processing protein FCF1